MPAAEVGHNYGVRPQTVYRWKPFFELDLFTFRNFRGNQQFDVRNDDLAGLESKSINDRSFSPAETVIKSHEQSSVALCPGGRRPRTWPALFDVSPVCLSPGHFVHRCLFR